MRVLSVAEALELEEGETPLAVKGTLTTLYQRKSGTATKGPNAGKEWSLQNGYLQVGTDGPQIKIKLDNRPPLPNSFKGQVIVIQAAKKKKGTGYTGVKVDLETRNNVTEKILKVYDSAIIETYGPSDDTMPTSEEQGGYEQGGPPEEHHQPQAQPQAQQQQDTTTQAGSTQTAPTDEKKTYQGPTWVQAAEDCRRLADIHFMIKRYVRNVYAANWLKEFAEALGPVDQHAISTTIYIEYVKKHHMGEIPAHPLPIHPRTLTPVQQ